MTPETVSPHTHTHTHREKDTHSHGVSFSDLSTCIGHPHKTFIYKSYDACQDHVLVLFKRNFKH